MHPTYSDDVITINVMCTHVINYKMKYHLIYFDESDESRIKKSIWGGGTFYFVP